MKAEVIISRTSSNQEDDYITVEIKTAARVIEVKLTLADFALILTGRGAIEGEVMADRERKKR